MSRFFVVLNTGNLSSRILAANLQSAGHSEHVAVSYGCAQFRDAVLAVAAIHEKSKSQTDRDRVPSLREFASLLQSGSIEVYELK